MIETEADPRWALVCARDKSADGTFFTAVKTTGIFCRPSCPARPKPQNVMFFQTAAEAMAAGYRACLRCRPLELDDPITSRMAALADYIRAHADEPLPLSRLAKQAGLSPQHLQRSFKAIIGVSPKALQAAERLKGFKAELRQGADVLSAAFSAGYGSTSRIYEQIENGLGMAPGAYRAGGAGERIRYALRQTALGPLMLAATDRGVCFVRFGEGEAALLAELRAEFPKAELLAAPKTNDEQMQAWANALDAHISRSAPRPDVPLHLRGTAFQIRVWRFLLSIKDGQTASYSQAAAAAGNPSAHRAAANACGANKIAVLVPCHRVLRGDGSIGGYRGGVERKKALLRAEKVPL